MTAKFRLNLPEDQRAHLCTMLNQVLANLVDLGQQVKVAHWNVKGKHFMPLHKLFDELYEPFAAYVDDVAERIKALGGYAHGSIRQVTNSTDLPDFPSEGLVAGEDYVRVLRDRYMSVCSHIRGAVDRADEYNDQGTNDLLVGISRQLDKHLWFLDEHLL